MTADRTWTVKSLLDWATQDFAGKGIDTARLDAEILLAHAMKCGRIDLYLRFEETFRDETLDAFREAVKKRRGREPVAHIVGKKPFHDIEVTLKPGLFVPRPETEILVDETLARFKKIPLKNARLLELGTGTGAVTLAVLHALPLISALATDLDPQAGENLMENARRLGLADRVEFRRGDLFEPVGENELFQIIVMNPPYVPTGEIPGLMPEVRDHEPIRALDGGEDGLDVVRRLVEGAPPRLHDGGFLIMELGNGQAEKVAALPGMFHDQTRKDLRGCPRIVVLRK